MSEFKRKYFLILFVFLCSCSNSPDNFSQREYGTLLWVGSSQKDSAIKKAVHHTLESSSVIIAQIPWSPNNDTFLKNIEWYSNLAKDHGKILMVNIDWQNNDRTGTRGNWYFKSDKVKKRFLMDMHEIVKKYSPNYLTLGIEVNYFALTDPEDFVNFIELFNKVKSTLKKNYPKLEIGLSYQLELLYGLHTGWNPERSLQALDAVVENLDYLGISTYPKFTIPKKNKPFYSIDYLDSISSTYKLPIGISETGVTHTDFDEEERKEYISLIFQKYQSENLKFLIWGSIIDGSGETNWENEIGLMNFDGSTKPEFSLWKQNMEKISE